MGINKLLLISWAATILYIVTPSKDYEVIFSPHEQPQSKIVNLIDNTKSKIFIAMYAFTNKRLAKALKYAKKRGVEIELIIDKWSSESKYAQVPQGLTTYLYSGKGLMHNKFAIFDNATLCTGSLNWTGAACFKNQENTLIIHNRDLCHNYRKYFENLKGSCKRLE